MSTNNQNQTSSPSGADGIQMKDSGIPWIGLIPGDWEVSKMNKLSLFSPPINKSVYSLSRVGYVPLSDLHNGYSTPHSINPNNIPSGLNYFENGDIIVAKVTPCFENGEIAIVDNLVNGMGFGSSELFVFRSPIAYRKYVFYLLQSSLIRQYCVSTMTGVAGLKRVSSEFIRKIKIPLPPISVIARITTFLDTQCNLIDQQIAAVKDSIEKLEQVKISKVYQVITKGLDTSGNYADSGVPWIGQYPVSWDLRPLKSMFIINKRIAGTLGYDVLSITQKGIKIKDIVSNVGQQSSDYSKYQIVKPGDFAMNHMDLLTGFVDLSEVEGVTSPDYRVFTPVSKDIDPHYALYIFQTAYKAKIFYGLGQGVSTLGRWRLPKEQFLNFVIPVPSLGEQGKIVRYLDSFCSSVDGLIQSYTDKLDSLMNFKASLIYEYVTGKKQVPSEVDA